MKLLITSPDALIDNETGVFFSGMTDALDHFLNLEAGNTIAVISVRKTALIPIPAKYNPIQIPGILRGNRSLITRIKDDLKLTTADIYVLGCKDKDVQTAANSKLLLLRAEYAITNNPNDKIYSKSYGIGLTRPNSLKIFFDHFYDLGSPWYYKLDVSDKTVFYALTDARTYYKPETEKILNDKFRQCLKEGDKTYRVPFMIYFLVSSYLIVQEMETVDYFGIYPSSKVGDNPDLGFFLQKAGQSYKAGYRPEILQRKSNSITRHTMNPDQRKKDGCNSQFKTVIINPYYRNKLKGKTVCIIDDFSTWGTSCETTRLLLEGVGVKKVIFIALGKFGNDYYKYDYEITGDVFGTYSYKQKSYGLLPLPPLNKNANAQFLDSLRDLI
jgi:hypothetical protein